MLAAALAAGSGEVLAAEPQVERGDTAALALTPAAPSPVMGASPAAEPPLSPAAPAPAPAVPPPIPPVPGKPPAKSQSEKERDAKLHEAQKRLEAAAAEVAALSSEIATEAMQGLNNMWADAWTRRAIIGVQLEADYSGTGARVREVSPGGAAEAAGIRAGDVIVAVNGTTVKGGAREVVRILRGVEPESTVQVRVMRDGKPKDFKVTARKFEPRTFVYTPPDTDFDFNFDFDPRAFGGAGTSVFRGGLAGLEVTALTPQLARYFGTDEGLLVLRAPKGEVYKLQDGDVILSIDGRVPTNGSHVGRILRSYQAGEKLTLRIMRDRKPMDLQVTLPDDDRNRRVRATRILSESTPL